ncbi:MAG: cell wall hydrolase [Butyrivibrio sp.]|nr:cell wall hydrolase [Muribaculum sp.]MCM1551518.1 cell wall hydrolase [Butyrivibrio sp.]
MYKKALGMIFMLYLIFFFGTICVKSIAQNRQAAAPLKELRMDERVLSDRGDSTMGIMDTAVSGQRVVDVRMLERGEGYHLGSEDLDILTRIVEAEAGNQDVEGRLLVANVVLNRVESEKFPNSVKDVVFQEEKGVCQFSPVSNGRIWEVQVSKETDEAVERALEGEDISDGALYFVARKYADGGKVNWFDSHLTYLFEYGGHEFFK